MIYDVREGIRQIADDTDISDRYITHLININRADLIRQSLNNFQRVTPSTVTQSFCLEMEEVSALDCGITTDCETILRSKRIIPDPLELHLKTAITSIRPVNKLSKPFTFTSKERAMFTEHSPFKHTISAFVDNDNYVYITGKDLTHKLISCVSVTGIFEDPLSLNEYSTCCGCDTETTCFDIDDSEYPVPAHLITRIREAVLTTLAGSLRLPEDKINNSDEQ